MGLELAEKNINYIRINIDDLPKNLFLHHQMEDGELETYIEGTGFNRLNIKQIKLAWFRRFYDFDAFDNISNNVITNKYADKEWKYFSESLINQLDCTWINHPHSIKKLIK